MITRTGLVVPFHTPITTSEGRITVAPGDVTWPKDLSHVKLLFEHDQAGPVLGYATDITEEDEHEIFGAAGIWAVFAFPQADDTDSLAAAAVAGIDLKLRNGLSSGIDFDDATKVRVRRAQTAAVRGAGRLREVSLCSVPAAESARFRVGQ